MLYNGGRPPKWARFVRRHLLTQREGLLDARLMLKKSRNEILVDAGLMLGDICRDKCLLSGVMMVGLRCRTWRLMRTDDSALGTLTREWHRRHDK